jgi:hypothetical protein
MDKLMMYTCDENWKEEHFADRVKNKEMVVYKKLQLANFKVYWNTVETKFIYGEDKDEDELVFEMNKMILK